MVDTASGEKVHEEEAHDGALWSIAVRGDGKGFATGRAHKIVKFWEFGVSKISIILSLFVTAILLLGVMM